MARFSIDIKVLKDLKENPVRTRSAGACPPRAHTCPRRGEGQALALREICRSRSPDLDPVAIWRSQTTDVGSLNRLGALKEKFDKHVYTWYNLTQYEISVVEEEKS